VRPDICRTVPRAKSFRSLACRRDREFNGEDWFRLNAIARQAYAVLQRITSAEQLLLLVVRKRLTVTAE
jgi:hypothetical protein